MSCNFAGLFDFLENIKTPPLVPRPPIIPCKDCYRSDYILKITEEDVCSRCQRYYIKEYFCVDCYKKRLTKRPCIYCHKMIMKDRIFTNNETLQLGHPDKMQDICSICGSDDSVMFQSCHLFCEDCINIYSNRFICSACYIQCNEFYTCCFYCLGIAYSNPEKLQYK